MAKMKQPRARIHIYSPVNEYEDIKKYAKELDLSISSFCVMLLKLGLQVVKVSRDPSMIEYFKNMENLQASEKKNAD